MTLIPEAKQAHKMWSVRLSAIAAVLGGLEVMLSSCADPASAATCSAAVLGGMESVVPALQGVVPDGVFGVLSAVAAVGAGVSRVIKQRNLVR